MKVLLLSLALLLTSCGVKQDPEPPRPLNTYVITFADGHTEKVQARDLRTETVNGGALIRFIDDRWNDVYVVTQPVTVRKMPN